MAITFALIKERKNPPDKRVVLTPKRALKMIESFPEVNLIVESSDVRAFSDEAYASKGIEVTDDVAKADVMLGVKEVPIHALIPNKKYLFFSHTIKKQPYNRNLLRAILDKKIELYDHETIVDESRKRLIGFGFYAGIVGAYNGFRGLGLRKGCFTLPKMEDLHDLEEAKKELDKIKIPPIKIVVTGSLSGKVTQGAKDIIDHLGIKQVTPNEFRKIQDPSEPIYTIIGVEEYNRRKDGEAFDKSHFYAHPKEYESDFMKYATVAEMFIACHFYGEGAPYIYTREDAKHPDFNIKVVADISCDIDGPVASTIRPSTIAEPFYGYDPITEQETGFTDPNAITVMAVDNLPCELPRDASQGFGRMFVENVLPAFLNDDQHSILERAQITTSEGTLTERFKYLQSYVDASEVQV